MDLNNLRNDIDSIDEQILYLFIQRMEKTNLVAKHKKENNIPVLNSKREREILSRVTKGLSDDMSVYTKILFNTLFDLSRSNQSSIIYTDSSLKNSIEGALKNTPSMFPRSATVACQGIQGAYSQLAADKLFQNADIMYFNNFQGVMTAVEKGFCKYGVLPIENNLYGSVGEVYDLMNKNRFYIVKSIKLRINHCLIAKKNIDLKNIKEIYSHQQAIGQCSEFLKKYPDIKINIVENTAIAANLVANSERDGIAAISSDECAELYSLVVLQDMIQNSDNNYTRFICISKNLEIYPGADKISIMFTLPHKSGTLYTLISKFAAQGFNLSKLESRTIPGKDFEFMFYIDFEASIYSEATISLLNELESGHDSFVFLGSYSETL